MKLMSLQKLENLLESLYGGQFTLSTPLIKPNFCILLPHRRSTTVSLETTPSFNAKSLLSMAKGWGLGDVLITFFRLVTAHPCSFRSSYTLSPKKISCKRHLQIPIINSAHGVHGYPNPVSPSFVATFYKFPLENNIHLSQWG